MNTVVHRSLPTLPLGLLAGAVAFDLLRRRRPAGSPPDVPTVVGTWLAAFAGQYLWLQAVGKTWWKPGDVVVCLVAGTAAALGGAALGSYLGRRIRATADGEPVERPSPVRFAALVLVTSGVLYLAGLPLLTLSGVAPRTAQTAVTGRLAVLDVDGATSDDWVSVFTQTSERDGYRWVAALDWRDGRFTGEVPDPSQVPFLAFWYVDGSRAYVAVGYGAETTDVPMVPDYFSPAQPSTSSKVLASLLPLIVLFAGITAPLRYALHARPDGHLRRGSEPEVVGHGLDPVVEERVVVLDHAVGVPEDLEGHEPEQRGSRPRAAAPPGPARSSRSERGRRPGRRRPRAPRASALGRCVEPPVGPAERLDQRVVDRGRRVDGVLRRGVAGHGRPVQQGVLVRVALGPGPDRSAGGPPHRPGAAVGSGASPGRPRSRGRGRTRRSAR